jgi:antitoxin (DNA-binding transcriptional repressor) of toxin-antitoxin stability system
MATIRLSEANLQEFLSRVRAGEKITLAENGHTLAHVVPVARRDPQQVRQAITRWREVTKDWSLQGAKIKDLISEGRR